MAVSEEIRHVLEGVQGPPNPMQNPAGVSTSKDSIGFGPCQRLSG